MFEEYLESLFEMIPYSYVFSWGEEIILKAILGEMK